MIDPRRAAEIAEAEGALPADRTAPDPANRADLDDDAQNVTVEQTSGGHWDIVVMERGDLVGRVVQTGDRFVALEPDGAVIGDFDSLELATFGVVTPH